MNNVTSIRSTVPYVGTVEFSLQLKNGDIVKLPTGHNHAMPEMSKFFAKAMLGYDVKSSIPVKLTVCDSTDVDLLTRTAPLTGRSYSKITNSDSADLGFYEINYNALITPNMKNSVVDTANVPSKLVMMNNDNEIFATINFPGTTALSELLTGGNNLIINWKLVLCNYSNNDNE